MGDPSRRSIRHALSVLERLPPEALADLTERLVDRLDAVCGDDDLEPDDDDWCQAEETSARGDLGIGDADDAEDDDPGGTGTDDEPDFLEGLRAEAVRWQLGKLPRQLHEREAIPAVEPIGRKRVPGGAWEPWS